MRDGTQQKNLPDISRSELEQTGHYRRTPAIYTQTYRKGQLDRVLLAIRSTQLSSYHSCCFNGLTVSNPWWGLWPLELIYYPGLSQHSLKIFLVSKPTVSI